MGFSRVLPGYYTVFRRNLTSPENRDFVCSLGRGRSGLFHENIVSLMALLS